MSAPAEPQGGPVAEPQPSGAVVPEAPAERLRRVVMVLVFVVVGAVGGFSAGRVLHKQASENDQPPTSERFRTEAVRLGLLGGAFLGVIIGVASVPNMENDLRRVLSRQGLVSILTCGVGGTVLGASAGALCWAAWSVLSGSGGLASDAAAKYAGSIAGGVLALPVLWFAARLLRAQVAAELREARATPPADPAA